MYFGLVYYPEHRPEDGWPIDENTMYKAGVNGERMGEFAMRKRMPTPDPLDSGSLDRAINMLSHFGIQTVKGYLLTHTFRGGVDPGGRWHALY